MNADQLIAKYDATTNGGASRYHKRLLAMGMSNVEAEIRHQTALDRILARGKPSWMQLLAREVYPLNIA